MNTYALGSKSYQEKQGINRDQEENSRGNIPNVFENCMMGEQLSRVDFEQNVSDPEQVLRIPFNHSFFSRFLYPEKFVQEHIDTLDVAFGSKKNELPFISKLGTASTPKKPLQFLNYPRLRTEKRQIAQEEVRRVHALFVDKFILKSATNALLNVFQLGFESSDAKLKKTSSRFAEDL